MNEERKITPLDPKIDHWMKMNERDYLGGYDIPVGAVVKVKIVKITEEEMYNSETREKEEKKVLWFEGKTKRLVLNKLKHPKAIASWHGDNPHNWIGKEIELESKDEMSYGELKRVIRIKAKSTVGKKSSQAINSVGK